jgi:hypothetical protein
MSKLQTKTIKEYQKKGYLVINLIVTNLPGIPDILALKDGEKPLFIEIKEKGDTVKPLQEYRKKELINLGFQSIIKKANE